VPVKVSGITNAMTVAARYGITCVTAIAAGNGQTCAVLSSGAVQCWGDNTYGELGNGATTGSSVPVTVSGITNAGAVAAGAAHSCALLADGTVQCWGHNTYSELGNGTATGSSVPVKVLGVYTSAAVVAAGYAHTCAVYVTPVFDYIVSSNGGFLLRAGGTAQCWGDNSVGQLGNGSKTDSSVPVSVIGF
jgi:alpha-tubulin suppressor-like RCC1 family protein